MRGLAIRDGGIAIVYHRIDWDGWMSAALLHAQLCREGLESRVTLLGMNHSDQEPEGLDGYGTVFMVDFSLPMERMLVLDAKTDLIWIDHHASVMDLIPDGHVFRGLQDTSMAACSLCWRWLYGEDEAEPAVVSLLGCYDVFDKSGSLFPWEDILCFQTRMRLEKGSWQKAREYLDLEDEDGGWIERYIGEGRLLLAQKRHDVLYAWKAYGRDVTCGRFRGRMLMSADLSSMMTEPVFEEDADHGLDFLMLLNADPRNGLVKVSVRVPEWSRFDAARWAAGHAGGGHTRASSGSITFAHMQKAYASGRI